MNHFTGRFKILFAILNILNNGPLHPLNQHLDRAVWQLQQLKHSRNGTDPINVVDPRRVVSCIQLAYQKDFLVTLHHCFQRIDAFIATNEQWNDHMREHDDVPQWENWELFCVV